MNRKSALNVRESGGNVAGKNDCFNSAYPATGKVRSFFLLRQVLKPDGSADRAGVINEVNC